MFPELLSKVNELRKQNPTNKNISIRDLFLNLWTDENGDYRPFQLDEYGRMFVMEVDARINDKNEIELFERVKKNEKAF